MAQKARRIKTMRLITATEPHTQKRTNLFEIKIDGRVFWFLHKEISLAESRPVYYKEPKK